MMTLLANKHLKTGEFFRAMWRVTNVDVVAFYQVWTNNENWMTLDMQFCKSPKKNDNKKNNSLGIPPNGQDGFSSSHTCHTDWF